MKKVAKKLEKKNEETQEEKCERLNKIHESEGLIFEPASLCNLLAGIAHKMTNPPNFEQLEDYLDFEQQIDEFIEMQWYSDIISERIAAAINGNIKELAIRKNSSFLRPDHTQDSNTTGSGFKL